MSEYNKEELKEIFERNDAAGFSRFYKKNELDRKPYSVSKQVIPDFLDICKTSSNLPHEVYDSFMQHFIPHFQKDILEGVQKIYGRSALQTAAYVSAFINRYEGSTDYEIHETIADCLISVGKQELYRKYVSARIKIDSPTPIYSLLARKALEALPKEFAEYFSNKLIETQAYWENESTALNGSYGGVEAEADAQNSKYVLVRLFKGQHGKNEKLLREKLTPETFDAFQQRISDIDHGIPLKSETETEFGEKFDALTRAQENKSQEK